MQYLFLQHVGCVYMSHVCANVIESKSWFDHVKGILPVKYPTLAVPKFVWSTFRPVCIDSNSSEMRRYL